MYFTDIHCHMLPGADDGSKSREESLEMLKIAYQEGIRRVCVTPHYQPDRFAVDENMLQEQYTLSLIHICWQGKRWRITCPLNL